MVEVLGNLAAPMDDKAVMFPLYIVGLCVLGNLCLEMERGLEHWECKARLSQFLWNDKQE